MNKIDENIQAAQLLYDKGLYNASANRSYYAALQSADLTLNYFGIKTKGIDYSRTQADFALELIHRRKIFQNHLKSYLEKLRLIRNKADYSSESISKKQALRQLKQSKEFIEILAMEVKK